MMDLDKLNKWADLLLDTGKRNNLINFKDSKTGTVEVVSPDFSSLFSKAEHSATFEVYDPKLNDEESDEEIIETREQVEQPNNEQKENFKEKRISKSDYTGLYERYLKKPGQVLIYNPFINPIRALRNIGKKAKTAIEETGVNIAYMAFGFIDWTENENSQCIMHAPILLAPISIENDSAIDPYFIKVTDSDIIVNPTFSFKLKNDYGIELPDYEDEEVDEYLKKIEEKLSKLKWTITRECKIGIFSFLKINMYKDLKDNAAKILKNKGVRVLLGEETDPPISCGDAEADVFDNTPIELYNVVDADSSQAEAIALARSGKSFVLQGPPGTGKSQTITNIIAECLASGKNVLFVSEKLAALSVVYDKLKKAGLEEFCLELHSHKANKKDLLCKYQGCLDSIDKLDNWCEFVKLLKTLSTLEIRKFVDYAINKHIQTDVTALTYEKAFYIQWIDAILHESPVLITMSRIPHDEAVNLFKTKDELCFEINKAKIKAKLSADRPSLDMIAQGSAISILLREGEKKRKQKGIRLLLEEIGELVQTLKPCFLMSPLSVSTFLSPDINFDVVVFDEASQIFPQDAIGAIYRGK